MIHQADLKKWSSKVISDYRDGDFHWVLSILRISQILPPRNRDKGLLLQCLKNFLLPLDTLTFNSHVDRYKMYRLREIFKKIRLLSLVTLDSYYSHHPVRYQIATAIMDLENLFSEQDSGFEELLVQTARWLADELYMHPSSAAALRYYEIQSAKKFNKYYGKFFVDPEDFKSFMGNFMNNGLGQPSIDHLKVFLRVSLSSDQIAVFNGKDTYEIRNILEKQISKPRKTRISVLKNPFSGQTHLDLLYDYYEAKPLDIGGLCCGLYSWLIRAIQIQVDSRIEDIFPNVEMEKVPYVFQEELKNIIFNQSINDLQKVFSQLLRSLIRYLLPEDILESIVDFIPSNDLKDPFLIKLEEGGFKFNNIGINLSNSIYENPFNLHSDRVQEIKAVMHVAQYSRFPFVIACADKIILRDSGGKHVAEWDGVLLEISKEHTRLNIVEAKNKSTAHQNEQEAFEQLARCRSFIKLRHQGLDTERIRIPNVGAKLRINLC